MRSELILCASRSTARRRAPWAAAICKCEGGFLAFESSADAMTWKAQR